MSKRAPRLVWLHEDDPPEAFPPLSSALSEPDGLLAAGGDLSSERILFAYMRGIFPWYDTGQPILWWSPDPRCIILPGEIRRSRRLTRYLRKSSFEVSFDESFEQVVGACAESRAGQPGTWITAEMHAAYCRLHREGWAHSVEIWSDGDLAGGLYGLSIGRAFFGESMFTRVDHASKAALIALCAELVRRGFMLLDCQVASPHLFSMGAVLIPRQQFAEQLQIACVGEKQQVFKVDSHRSITEYF